MIADIARMTGNYLHDGFLSQLDWWIVLGFVAQIMFTMRFMVQWIASERAGKSVIPMSVWSLSIAGGALLLLSALVCRGRAPCSGFSPRPPPPDIRPRGGPHFLYLFPQRLLPPEGKAPGEGG